MADKRELERYGRTLQMLGFVREGDVFSRHFGFHPAIVSIGFSGNYPVEVSVEYCGSYSGLSLSHAMMKALDCISMEAWRTEQKRNLAYSRMPLMESANVPPDSWVLGKFAIEDAVRALLEYGLESEGGSDDGR